MKATGIIRKMDELGRITIPIELRRLLNIKENEDYLEIYVENDIIALKKHESSCTFCRESRNVVSYKGKCVCRQCLEELTKA